MGNELSNIIFYFSKHTEGEEKGLFGTTKCAAIVKCLDI